jgi:hypothetical protein
MAKPTTLVAWLDSLTPEQACRLIQIADPLTPEAEALYGAMTDDELLAALKGLSVDCEELCSVSDICRKPNTSTEDDHDQD